MVRAGSEGALHCHGGARIVIIVFVLCGKKSARLPGFFVHILPYRGQLTHMCGPALVTLGGIHVEEITVRRRSLVDGEDVAPFDTESVNETWPVNEKPRLRLSLVYVA